jgi:eukaryotic-like serine/threonine-protein kinase
MFEGELSSHRTGLISQRPYRYQIGEYVGGRYFVRGQIGQGGMGAILRVEDMTNGQVVALKYCDVEGDDRRRFAREVRSMRLVDHLNVIRVLDVNLEHDPPYFAMPLAERSAEDDLRVLQQDEDRVLDLFVQVCAGVRALHDQGIYHRDLKPANILLMGDGAVVVSDLGLACFKNRDSTFLTQTVAPIGTEDYIAPEQWLPEGTRQADARIDVYQLGRVLYRLLTGRPPSLMGVMGVGGGLGHIVSRATNQSPERRYPSVAKLEEAILDYRRSKDPAQSPREVLAGLVARIEAGGLTPRDSADAMGEILKALLSSCWLDPRVTLECFHLVPPAVHGILAQERTDDFRPVLTAYADAIKSHVTLYHFSFADDVGERMAAILDTAQDVPTKVVALRALMHAADLLGRYQPQKRFSSYLESVKTNDLALPIKEMIEEHGRPSVADFKGLVIELLHPLLQRALRGLKEPAGKEPIVTTDPEDESFGTWYGNLSETVRRIAEDIALDHPEGDSHREPSMEDYYLGK